jgi:trimethylamine-N-oxide reductase (cytochrome c)
MSIPEIIRSGWEFSGVADKISWEDLCEKGYYVVSPDPDWENLPAGFTEFYGPGGPPLSTTSSWVHRISGDLPPTLGGPGAHWIQADPPGDLHRRSKRYPSRHEQPRWGCSSMTSPGFGRSRPARSGGKTDISITPCG